MGEITDDGSWVLVEGGMGSVSEFLAKLAVEKGVKICLNSPVKEIIIDGKKAKGIILSTGEKIYGNNIITNCTDFVTFNKLINQKELNPRVK